jgi:hypothetical protein
MRNKEVKKSQLVENDKFLGLEMHKGSVCTGFRISTCIGGARGDYRKTQGIVSIINEI